MRLLFVVVLFSGLFLTALNAGAQESDPFANASRPGLDVDTDLQMGPILLGSFSVVAIGVGAGFGWQADQEYDDWKDAQSAGDGDEMDDLSDDVHTHSLAANILIFGGLAGVATSILWFIVASASDDDENGASVGMTARWRPVIGPGQAGLSLRF